MKKQSEMHSADFQKLLALELGDLAVRRTILENKVAEVNQELRSLEKDAELEKLDQEITAVQADFDHYRQFADPNFKFNPAKYYQGLF